MKIRFISFLPILLITIGLFTPTLAAGGFTDVPVGAAYAEAVDWCRENGLMEGVDGERFDPEGPLTRSMLATVLYRAEGSPAPDTALNFTDVQAGLWYSDAVTWAAHEGLMQGYGNGSFGPGDPVSIEMLGVIMARRQGETPTWTGDPAKSGPATRAQAALALYNTLYDKEDREDKTDVQGNVLVAYFSCTGTTKNAAEIIQTATQGDLFEIVPVIPYTAADLNYNDSSSRSQVEQQDNDARPAIQTTVDDMSSYDVVFLGYPIWNGRPPRIISTFLESYDFSGKTIVPFCTSGSSGFSSAGLTELAPDATWAAGRRLNGVAQDAATEWINSLSLNVKEDTPMKITVKNGDTAVIFALNNSPAAESLVAQLPLTLDVQPFSSNEQTFYPPEKLDTTGIPVITSAEAGTLAYFAPWGDVVMFYADFSGGSGGLYELGSVIDGLDAIQRLSGTVTITKSE